MNVMKDLLKNKFASSFGLTRNVEVDSRLNENISCFRDEIACADCNKKTNDSFSRCIEKYVFNVDFGDTNDVNIVELEKYFKQFSNVPRISSGNKCDLMLYNDSKCAFVELSCMNAMYIEDRDGGEKPGKRTKAYQQLSNSIEKLRCCPDIAEKLESYKIKHAIFAYREKDGLNVEDKMFNVIDAFNITDKISRLSVSDMGYGFYFVKVKFPEKYIW